MWYTYICDLVSDQWSVMKCSRKGQRVQPSELKILRLPWSKSFKSIFHFGCWHLTGKVPEIRFSRDMMLVWFVVFKYFGSDFFVLLFFNVCFEGFWNWGMFSSHIIFTCSNLPRQIIEKGKTVLFKAQRIFSLCTLKGTGLECFIFWKCQE